MGLAHLLLFLPLPAATNTATPRHNITAISTPVSKRTPPMERVIHCLDYILIS
jgi:hypothetical protein